MTGSRTVAGIVLAAGAGTRFGGLKATVRWQGSSLLERAVDALVAGGCDGVLAVVPPAIAGPATCRTIVNDDAAAGQSRSLRLALAALLAEPPGADAVVVTLVDTPGVTAEHVRRLISSGAPLAVAAYAGHRRTPVLLGRAHWAGVLAEVRGDRGAVTYLRDRRTLVTPVECGDLGPWWDVDVPADLPPC